MNFNRSISNALKHTQNSMNLSTSVSVIIPTIALKEKGALLKHAVESIRHSSVSQIRIIVVVNGDRADSDICQWLESQPDIHYERVPIPSAPLAALRGRELVQTKFFSFLDDDDEYLPGGTDSKLSAFSSNIDADIVITSGFRNYGGIDEPARPTIEDVSHSPLASLLQNNWLSSCNALYRSSSFPPKFFADPNPYHEWTWLAFKLTLAGKQILVLNQPTFRIYDTPGSLSKSEAYHDASKYLLHRMLDLDPPIAIARAIKLRLGSAWHDQSVRELSYGRRLDALTSHVRSLMLPGGLRYLTYTRRLIPGWPNEHCEPSTE